MFQSFIFSCQYIGVINVSVRIYISICGRANTCSLIGLYYRLSIFSQSCSFEISPKVLILKTCSKDILNIYHTQMKMVYYVPHYTGCLFFTNFRFGLYLPYLQHLFAIKVFSGRKIKGGGGGTCCLEFCKAFDIIVKLRTEGCWRKVIQIKWCVKKWQNICCNIIEFGGMSGRILQSIISLGQSVIHINIKVSFKFPTRSNWVDWSSYII